ncbi:MAG: hypothetical protein R3F40_16415 [Candidatus Competibacteraceae bacterium]
MGRLGVGRVTAFASIVACPLALGQFLLLRPFAARWFNRGRSTPWR